MGMKEELQGYTDSAKIHLLKTQLQEKDAEIERLKTPNSIKECHKCRYESLKALDRQLQVVNAGIKSAAFIMSKETGRDVRDLEDAKKKFSEALKLIKDAEE